MKTLILVDLQNDFLPGGALPVSDGDQVVPLTNALMPAFDLVIATQDWHPAGHGSFASSHPRANVGQVIDLDGIPQVLWPDHCVAGTFGAEFSPLLHVAEIDRVFRKGTDPQIDSYSGFFDNGHRKSTGLGDFLKQRDVSELQVLGVATDYCVKFTVLDALGMGLKVCLIEDACRGVDLRQGDVSAALSEMKAAGARLVRAARFSVVTGRPKPAVENSCRRNRGNGCGRRCMWR